MVRRSVPIHYLRVPSAAHCQPSDEENGVDPCILQLHSRASMIGSFLSLRLICAWKEPTTLTGTRTVTILLPHDIDQKRFPIRASKVDSVLKFSVNHPKSLMHLNLINKSEYRNAVKDTSSIIRSIHGFLSIKGYRFRNSVRNE